LIPTLATPPVCEVGPRSDAPHALIICYDFPGASAAGVIRTYQLAKNLPSFGWQPVILTARPCSGDHEDDIEASDGSLPCPKITEPPSRWLVPFETDHKRPYKPLAGAIRRSHPGLTRLVRFAAQLALPDGKIGWLHPAVQRALRVAHDHPIRLCLSVSPRPTSHLVAYRVARRLNIPWVADYALPWSDAYWLVDRPSIIRWLDQRLEGLVVRSAQCITVAYADLARSMAARYGHASRHKIAVIPTGFDEALFTGERPALCPKFTIVYPGNHFCEEGRYGEYFLKALDEWIDFEPSLKETIEFLIIGKRDEVLLGQRRAMAHPEVVRVEPLSSHQACIQAILSSHLCIVNSVGNRIPAKVYECMRAGKWILALTDAGSDLENLMRDYSRGVSVSAQNMPAIRNALQSIFQRNRCDTSQRNEADRDLYMHSSKHSAEMVSHIFDDLLLKPSQP
jgi:Glycosyl transferase 4-like domain